MSNISDAADKIVFAMEALFPDHLRMWNPYQPEENSEEVLRKGWGIGFGPAERTNRQLSCDYSWLRKIQIIQARQYFGTQLSTSKNFGKQKEILEDHRIMLDDFEKHVSLNQPGFANPEIVKFNPISDSGILHVYPDRDDFFFIRTTFDLEYFRQL